MRSNVTVGPPIEILYFVKDRLSDPAMYHAFEENDEYLVSLRNSWDENIVRAFNDLPSLNTVFSES